MSGAILEGQLYYDDLLKSGCAKISVRFRTSSDQLVSTYTNSVCSTGGLRQKSVYSQVNGAVRRITIQLLTSNKADGTGTKTSVGTKTFTI